MTRTSGTKSILWGSRKSERWRGGVWPFMFHVPTNTRMFRSGKYLSSSSAPSNDVGPHDPSRYERDRAWLTLRTGFPTTSAAHATAISATFIIDLDLSWAEFRLGGVGTGTPGGVDPKGVLSLPLPPL